MNGLKIFSNPDFGEVRTLSIDGEPWFVGKDVADILGYTNPRDALAKHVDDEDKNTVAICDGTPGNPNTTVINESGLYSLVLSSKLPTAKKFKRWVTSEVLPAIRKHGGYVAGQEHMSDEELMAKALLMAQKTIADRDARISALQVEVAVAQPKAAYFDELVDRNLLTGIRETAKELGIKQKVFVDFLLNKKYLHRSKSGKLTPTVGRGDGLFEMKECFNDKTSWAGTQVMVTPKGRETFRLLCQGM
jgi:prophage antirepressor-like protein